MALARREVRFIKFIIATAVVVAVAAAGCIGYRYLQDQKTEREKQAFNSAYDPGQTAELDAAKDESCVLPSSKESYAAGFDWTGTLEVTVVDAAIYDSFKASELAASHAGGSFRDDTKHQFLVCKVHIKNKNAVPQDESSRTKQKCFNISFLNLLPAGAGEVGYFDGTMEGAAEEERWDFKLAPGAEQTYTVGFALEDAGSLRLDDIGLTAAISPDAFGKYRFTLNIDDHRTKERA